jgi:uncharacterized protein YabN with tetrapyrrole methylase and pyrophosphatase domain
LNGRGQLVVVGTGIRTVGHLTTEAIAWMQRADELIHLVADPVAEDLVRRMNPERETTLQGFYGDGKPRIESYEQMIEYILSRVRSGALVCGAFYGHPGVFAYPPHESIRRARAEGYEAFMLPGISSEDCLFADLGIDPAVNGCQSYEATDFLLHDRAIDASSQLILWQVGALCDWTYRPAGYDLRAMPLLVDKLLRLYPPQHEVVIYEAAMFPGCPASVTRVPLASLAAAPISAACTLYIAPARAPQPDLRYASYFAPT